MRPTGYEAWDVYDQRRTVRCETCDESSDSAACATCWREKPFEVATDDTLKTWANVLPGPGDRSRVG